MSGRNGAALGLALLCTLVLAPAAAAAPRGLDLGFTDAAFNDGANPGRRTASLDDARAVGADTVRVQLNWSGIARTRPLNGANPSDPAYRWSGADSAIRDATRRGLRVLVLLTDAPNWAEGPHRPENAPRGTWRPDPRALAQFAEAAARRYPGVLYWQIWNEPNLPFFLTPQWQRDGNRWVTASAAHYRRMLNQSYAAIKRANPRSHVVAGGTAPYGDPPGGGRIAPATFMRHLLRRPTHFDIYDHHPYTFHGPRVHAINGGDVAVPDLGRLSRIVHSAVRHGRALPRRSKPLWITEISWDSSPPSRIGVTATRRARYLAEALYLLWRQGARTVLWYQVRDASASSDPTSFMQHAGVFLHSGMPKLAARAFAFPIECERGRHKRLRVWGKAPTPGTVKLMRGNRVVRRVRVSQRRVFIATVRGERGVRARINGRNSLTCRPH